MSLRFFTCTHTHTHTASQSANGTLRSTLRLVAAEKEKREKREKNRRERTKSALNALNSSRIIKSDCIKSHRTASLRTTHRNPPPCPALPCPVIFLALFTSFSVTALNCKSIWRLLALPALPALLIASCRELPATCKVYLLYAQLLSLSLSLSFSLALT